MAGACQYKIGSYVAGYPHVFTGMTGHPLNEEDKNMLDKEFESLITQIPQSTQLLLLYSTEEPTYQTHTEHLLEALSRNNIKHQDIVYDFKTHGEAGKYFKPVANKLLRHIYAQSLNKNLPNI